MIFRQSRPCRAAARQVEERGHRPSDRRQDRAVVVRSRMFETLCPVDNSVLAKVARGDAADIDSAASGQGRLQGLARDPGRRRDSCTRSPTRSRRAPTKSRCWKARTPARRSASCRRRRCARPRISASSPTACRRPRRPQPAGDRPLERDDCACRSARSASSRRGTRRSCCRPGRSRRRWRRAARSCTSRRNGRRSPPTCWSS